MLITVLKNIYLTVIINFLFRFSTSKGIAGATAAQKQLLNVPKAYADPRFNKDIDNVTGNKTSKVLTYIIMSTFQRKQQNIPFSLLIQNVLRKKSFCSELSRNLFENYKYVQNYTFLNTT